MLHDFPERARQQHGIEDPAWREQDGLVVVLGVLRHFAEEALLHRREHGQACCGIQPARNQAALAYHLPQRP